jgi:hypothetical protein
MFLQSALRDEGTLPSHRAQQPALTPGPSPAKAGEGRRDAFYRHRRHMKPAKAPQSSKTMLPGSGTAVSTRLPAPVGLT